jgi:hypothetical protein
MNDHNNLICGFLKEHVIGKSLRTDETIYQLEEGKLEGIYTDEMFFSDLLLAQNGIQFNMTTITREKIYFLDSNKKRGEIKKDFSGVSVFHYELSERKSTSQLTGIMRLLSSTVPEHTMESVVYGVCNIEYRNDQLHWDEKQLLYRDMPSDNSGFRPVAFDAKIRLFIENGKLRFEYTPSYFDVNIETFRKSLSKDQYPVFLTKEQ